MLNKDSLMKYIEYALCLLKLLYGASCFPGWDVKQILRLSGYFQALNWYNQFDVNIKSCEFHLMSHLLPFPRSGLSQACCLRWDRGQLASFSFSQMDSSLYMLPIGFLIATGLKWVGQEERKGAGNAVLSWCHAFCGWQVLGAASLSQELIPRLVWYINVGSTASPNTAILSCLPSEDWVRVSCP